MTPADVLSAFVKREAAVHKVTEERIRQDLRKKYKTFSADKTKEYQQYLYRLYKDRKPEKEPGEFVAKIGSEEELKRMSEATENSIEPYQFHFPDKCPYHPDAQVSGKMSRGKKAWICSVGGYKCMYRVVADRGAASSGKQINWEEFDRFQEDGGGDIEDYRKWQNDSSRDSGE